jgi:hypothetical protein
MNSREFFAELRQKQFLLIYGGIASLALLLILAIVSLFDSSQILGINRWIKPMKFFLSIGVYFWTVAVFLYFLEGFEKSKKIIAVGVTALMSGEMFLLVTQALRGTTSHFNHSSAFNELVFSLMGLLILINTFLIVYLAWLYFRAPVRLPRAIVWGMRLGLLIFLAASVEGGYMSAQIGHAVGVADGGAGILFFNWSSEGGDLRVAHFVGMHAFQIVPLFAALLERLQKRFSPVRPLLLTVVFAVVFFVSFTLVFVQALKGKPLLGREITIVDKK